MALSVKSVLQRIVDVGWRRRLLFFVPLLILLPVSLLAAVVLPGKFVARSLIFLQETSPHNPLSKPEATTISNEAGQQRLAAIRALVGSEYVLGGVVEEFDPSSRISPAARAAAIQQLRQSIDVRAFGADFLEFTFASQKADGMGAKLHAVISRFVEALMEQSGIRGADLVLERRKRELELAEQQLADVRGSISSALPGGLEGSLRELGDLAQRHSELAERLKSIQREMNDAAARLGVPELTREEADRELAAASTLDPGARVTENDAQRVPNKERVNDLRAFSALHATRTRVQDEIGDLTALLTRQKEAIEDARLQEIRLTAAQVTAAAARQAYEAIARQMEAVSRAGGQNLVTAPERMIILDPPRDPELRAVPRIYMLYGGIIAAMLLSFGLVIAAELLDGTIRYPEQLVSASGVPIIARLPAIPAGAITTVGRHTSGDNWDRPKFRVAAE